MNAIETVDIRKRFGKIQAVDGVSFTVGENKIVSLLGPNGAGKSTTISIICGLLRPDSGKTSVLGFTADKNPMEMKKTLGYIPQEIALYDDLSAEENLRFWGRLYGLSGGALRARTEEVLELTGLVDRKKSRVGTFSGGMKRRLNIGAALLHNPRVLIMDEPTVGIDPQSRRHILDSVKELNHRGVSILYTTHYMEEAQELSHLIAIMDRGNIIASGSHEELVRQVGTLDTVTVTVTGNAEKAAAIWNNLPEVTSLYEEGENIRLFVQDSDSVLPKLFSAAYAEGVHIHSVEVQEPNLEAVFLHLTGRALRD